MLHDREKKTVTIQSKDNYFTTIYSYIIGVDPDVMDGNYRLDQGLLTELFQSEALTRIRMISLVRNGIIFKGAECRATLEKVGGSIIRSGLISKELADNCKLVRDLDLGGVSLAELHSRIYDAIEAYFAEGVLAKYFPKDVKIQEGLKRFMQTDSYAIGQMRFGKPFKAPENLPFRCYQGVGRLGYMGMFRDDHALLATLANCSLPQGHVLTAPDIVFEGTEGSPSSALIARVGDAHATLVVDVENFGTESGVAVLREYLDKADHSRVKVVTCQYDDYNAGSVAALGAKAFAELAHDYPDVVEAVTLSRLIPNKSGMDVVVSAQAVSAYNSDPSSVIVLCSGDSDFYGILSTVPPENLCILSSRDNIAVNYADVLKGAGVDLITFRGEGKAHIRELVAKYIDTLQFSLEESMAEYADCVGITRGSCRRELISLLNTRYRPNAEEAACVVTFQPNNLEKTGVANK